jgi:formylglycine-generating enzyme required for sulfatase activity
MVVIPPGSFTMGSPSSEVAREQNEVPRHQVQIAHKLAVGKFAVTFDNWQACVDGGGCQSKPNPADQGWGRSSRPVINVSWDDAQAYVAWLKRKTGRVYRLLSEAEWEYAARAGTSTPFYTGNCINTNQANYDGNLDYANCGAKTGTSKEKTLPVGSYDANNFGLFDMAGNVWQWVQDCYHASYVAAPEDGSAWVNGCDMTRRVLRGGSWNSLPRYLRSASRDWDGASNAYDITGFRIARTF